MNPSDQKEAPMCATLQVHPDVVAAVRARMPSDGEQSRLAELFRVFGDPTRLRILTVLSVSEMCVCDLAQLLSMTPSAISHQLRLLKSAGLITYRREGKSVIYELADGHVHTMMKNGLEHIRE